MSDPATPTPTRTRARRTARPGAPKDDAATRDRVIDAAVACILERGFYRASSNEITRRAGVSWGVIQYYFGSREALMLAVLRDGARRFSELVAAAHADGTTVAERLNSLLETLTSHYGQPEYLAYVQIALNMDHDPDTSAEVRKTLREVAEQSSKDVRRMLREALGSATRVRDLADTVFLAFRGFGFSQQLLDTLSYDAVAPQSDRLVRQRRLLADALARFVEQETSPVS
jgi:AcrR family transcriptional regulator